MPCILPRILCQRLTLWRAYLAALTFLQPIVERAARISQPISAAEACHMLSGARGSVGLAGTCTLRTAAGCHRRADDTAHAARSLPIAYFLMRRMQCSPAPTACTPAATSRIWPGGPVRRASLTCGAFNGSRAFRPFLAARWHPHHHLGWIGPLFWPYAYGDVPSMTRCGRTHTPPTIRSGITATTTSTRVSFRPTTTGSMCRDDALRRG